MLEVSKKIGRGLDCALEYKAQMERAGYIDIEEVVDIWPMNRWPKDPKFKELGELANILF